MTETNYNTQLRPIAVCFTVLAVAMVTLAVVACSSSGKAGGPSPELDAPIVVSPGPPLASDPAVEQPTPPNANASRRPTPVPNIAGTVISSGTKRAAETCASDNESGIPCAPRNVSGFDLFSGETGSSVTYVGADTATVEDVLESGLRLAGTSPAHIAIRATADSSSVRCDWRGIARTDTQRERAIRFWLRLAEDDEIPDASFLETMFTVTMDTLNPQFLETAKSNFLSIARGGLSEEYLYLACHADFTVSEYILGAGPASPATVTVAYDRMDEARAYELYRREHYAGQFGDEPLRSRGDYEDSLLEIVAAAEVSLAEQIGGRDSVVFLAPMGAHNAIAVEVWQAVAQWDIQTDDEGTVNAVRYGTPGSDPEYTQTLANLKTRITTAAASDSHASTRIANVSGLTQHYRDIGAYGDITPDDGSTETFTPAQPPDVLTCAGGTAVTDTSSDRALVHDCEALLDAKDTLRGSATLDWSKDTAITSWEGVTAAGTPSRVTKLLLSSKSLSGSVPSEIGSLFELTHLNLSSNSLTGDIPRELGWLHNLQEIKLSGNSLTGCIPIALKSVSTNDLSSLNLLYCRPPAPDGLTAGTTSEDSVPLSWTAVSNAGKYRVEYSLRGSGGWTVDDESLTGTAHTVDGLTCETEYAFRVSAFGSGTTYAAAWSDPSAVLIATSGECISPVFEEDPYELSIDENSAIETEVGVLTATDPQDDTVTYTITAGNDDGKFAIGASTGSITVAGELDHETESSYALTVQASDGTNTATAGVEITVTDVNEPPVFESETYSFTVAEDFDTFDTIGLVTAIDPDEGDTVGESVFYHITAGNIGGRLAVDGSSGIIFAWRTLDYETTPSYTLTVEARDGKEGGTSSATVEVTVTNVPEGKPSAPENPNVSVSEGTFTIGWDSVNGAGDYRAQHRTGGSEGTWTDLETVTGTSTTFSPEGGLVCSTTYDFRVQARGDGVDHLVDWGVASETVSHTTEECKYAPAFGQESYSFTVSEDAAVGATVGSVPATDANASDTLEYSLTGSAFAIDSTSGAITVAAALDYETILAFCLTATVEDGNDGQDTAPVTITVTDVDEVTPPVPGGLVANLDVGSFGLSWDTVEGADQYRIQYRIGGSTGKWTNLEALTGTSQSFTPEGGIRCETSHEFRVQAHGDGDAQPAPLGFPVPDGVTLRSGVA